MIFFIFAGIQKLRKMALINEHYQKLAAGYLFPEIGRRVREFEQAHPENRIIRMGIGDVTQPLAPLVIRAFHEGVDEMASAATFRGYGPEQGYGFLREAIAERSYRSRGADISGDDIFVSDGSKCDTGNIQEIFDSSSRVAICDPVYPVYADTTVMAGKTGSCFLCYPNNPTGSVATRKELQKWVDYALEHKSIILFDAAYEAFIRDAEIPHSIYEIKGAKKAAIEFRSLSKTAGFTGTRLAYTVIPEELVAYDSQGNEVQVKKLWNRRHTTKFNGVSYPVQRAAAAVFTDEGQREVQVTIDYYMENAALIRKSLGSFGYTVYGGENAPYIWVKTRNGMKSWDFFDLLLGKAHVVGTPGSGFGPS